jgi:peptidoglycan hydrolase-like amidase
MMNKVLIVIAFLIVPFFATAQNDTKTEISTSKTEIKAAVKQEVTIKKYDKITIDPKKQNLDLNFKKSNDIIDVKAYIKSLQLKRKATVIG